MNCFMTYRLEKQKEIAQKCPGANHRDISKIIANWWRKEPEDIKKQYRDIAEVNKLEHSQKYPNYKYAPKKRDKKQESRKNSKPNNPLPVRVSRSMPVSLLPSPTAPFLPCPHLGMFPSAPQPPSFLFHPAPPSQWFDPFVGADSSLAQPLPCTSTSSLGSCEGQAPLLESSFSSSTIMSASTSNSDLDELMAHDFLAPSPSLYLPQEIMPAYSLQDYLVSDVPEEVPSSKIPIPD
ncbi:high mobility group box domain-containing protein [Syncephalastrum racemosum]|uniref:High mobility group box domain-containing protein n=1 Tax=Syncephalastrum racemosum TaxID=13706 RepID=A0A1X2H2X6_SYNRA|nr:high mobility group box domain-containing protein [Syncephalastrum racemosum]